MRTIYFGLFLFFTLTLSAQDGPGARTANSPVPEVKLYPNPAFGNTVQIVTQVDGNKSVMVYDVFGEVVLTDRIQGRTLDISRLVSGVYVLQITEKDKTLTRKLVVK